MGRLFRLSLAISVGLPLLVAAILVLVVALLRSGLVNDRLDEWITALARKDGVFFVRVENVSGELPWHLLVDRVEIGDGVGVWLTVEKGEVHWHPFDTLTLLDEVKWRVHVESVSAARVEWTRLPVDDEDEDDEPFRWDRFPRILAHRLRVDDLDLSGTILDGERARLRAEGGLVLGEWEHGFVDLRLERIDGRRGHAHVDLRSGGSPLEFGGTVTASEEAGGALVALARLHDGAEVELEATASGPLADWRVTAKVWESEIGRLAIESAVSFGSEGKIRLEGSFDPVPRQRERYLVGEGAPMGIRAEGAIVPDVEIRVDAAELVADGRVLRASGRLDLSSREYRLDAEVAAERRGERVELAGLSIESSSAGAEGTLDDGGSMDADVAVVAPAIDGWSAESLRAAFRARDPVGDEPTGFTFDAEVHGLESGDALPPLVGSEPKARLRGALDLERGLLDAREIEIAGQSASVEGSAKLDDDFRVLTVDVRAVAESLETLTPAVGTRVSGAASVELDARVELGAGKVSAVLSAGSEDLDIGEAGWDAMLGDRMELRAEFEGFVSGPATASATLNSPALSVNATGSVGEDGRDLVADLELAADNLSRLAKPAQAAIAGRLGATVSVRGRLDDFAMDASVQGRDFSFEGLRFDRLRAGVRATGLPERWSGDVSVDARYGEIAATIEGAAAMPDARRLVLQGVKVDGPRTNAAVDLDIDLERGLAAGTVRGGSKDLSLWRPFVGVGLGGAIEIDASLAKTQGENPQQTIAGTASLRDVALAIGDRELFVDALDLTAENSSVGVVAAGTASLAASRVRYGDLYLVKANGEARGEGAAWAFDAGGELGSGRRVAVDVSGSLSAGSNPVLTLARLGGDLGGVAVELARPATISFSGGGIAADSIGLRFPSDGTLELSLAALPSGFRVTTDLARVPLAPISAFVPEVALAGTVDGRVSLAGSSVATLEGSVALRGNEVAADVGEDRAPRPVDATVQATLARGRVAATVSLSGLTDTSLGLKANLPLAPPSASDPVDVELVWRGDLGEAATLVPFWEERIEGRIDADLRLTGSAAQPSIVGAIELEELVYENTASGFVLSRGSAKLVGRGTSLVLERLEGSDGGRGTIAARGKVEFGTLPAFEAELDVSAADAVLTRLDVATVRADAEVAVRAKGTADAERVGPSISGSVSGNARIAEARVHIPSRFTAGIPELEVEEIGGRSGKSDASSRRNGPKSVLDLAFDVHGDNRIFVSGRGLESEWKTDLHVGGTTADPRIEGTVQSVRGELELLGRRFDVSSATIRFDGGKGNRPYLALTATADANDITAVVDVVGPALHPEIELRSEPPLPRDEVLARVLFGQSAGNLSALQSVQLARSVSQLAGGPFSGGTSFLGKFGESLGLDRLGLESSDTDGSAALSASKYLTDDVYLRVQQGLTPEASKVAIEWEIFRNITVESDVSQDAQGEVGVSWRWDY